MSGTVRCPDAPTFVEDGVEVAHTVIGCGKQTPDVRDDEGFVDCTNCGMFFFPAETFR